MDKLMKYFLLSITNECNKACGYCVVRQWLNNPEYPDKAKAEDFIGFLEKEMQAGDVVEITGGEPTLFQGFPTILEWLKEHNAKVILRTNGARLGSWRKDYPDMVVVLARHDSSEDYMAERKACLLPHDLILDGIPEHLRQKEGGKPVFKNDKESPLESHPFKKMYHVTNDGKVRFMSCCDDDMGTIWDFKPRNYYCCPECPFALGAWNLAARIKPNEKEDS